MKKCPTCQKTFDDNLRFCQADGTPLVDDTPPVAEEPAFDPYATIVSSAPLAGTAPPAEPEPAAAPEAPATAENVSMASVPISEPDDILDVPKNDPLKTMYASDAEMQEILGSAGTGSEAAPPAEPIAPEPEPPAPSFGDMAPPPSPFSMGSDNPIELEPVAPPLEPEPRHEEPEPRFDEAATIIQPQMGGAFNPEPSAPPQQWTPPPAPDANWQNQQIGSNTPFQPPPPGLGGQNKTLPIVSLVLGIMSLCCYISPVTGLIAVITGFMGMRNANNDPSNYGGKGLAIAGMITGGILFLVGVAYYVIVILAYAGMIAGSMIPGN